MDFRAMVFFVNYVLTKGPALSGQTQDHALASFILEESLMSLLLLRLSATSFPRILTKWDNVFKVCSSSKSEGYSEPLVSEIT